MSIHARTVVLLLAVAGCDMIHQNAPPRVEETHHNASGDRAGLLACYDDCKRQDLDDGDAATCRNNCEAAYAVTATAADRAFDRAAQCIHECHDSRKCVKACKRAARRADATVTAAALERLGVCIDGCETDATLDAGDRWTCVRNCAMTTREAPPSS